MAVEDLPDLITHRAHGRVVVARADRRNLIRRIRRGAYRRVREETRSAFESGRDDVLARMRAVHEQLRAPHWFSHECAALLWGWHTWAPPGRTSVYQNYRASGHAAKDIARHRAELPHGSTTVHRGLPVTSKVRTAADCALTLESLDALVVLDGALADGVHRDDIAAEISGRRDPRGKRSALHLVTIADGGAQSPWETWVRYVLVQAGFPVPMTQVPVMTRLGEFRCDLGWPDWGVMIEFDGRIKYEDRAFGQAYSGSRALMREKTRGDAILEAGTKMVRVTAGDDPRELVRRITRLLPPEVTRTLRPHRTLPPPPRRSRP